MQWIFLLCACVSFLNGQSLFFEKYFKVDHYKVLDETLGYKIFWSIDGDSINLGIAAKTTGWIGFGITEPSNPSMPGSDILLGYYDQASSRVVVKDAYALNFVSPTVDKSQDWQLLGGQKENGVTMFAVKRKLVTSDAADRPIDTVNPIPIIYACGEMSRTRWEYHGPDKRRSTYVNLSPSGKDPLVAIKNNPDVLVWDFLNNFTLQASMTQYIDVTSTEDKSAPQAFKRDQDGWHILGFEPVIQKGSEPFLHHFVVGSGSDLSNALWAWAPGMETMLLPPECGFAIKSGIHLNTHYHNLGSYTGKHDQSGVRVYYTKKLRQHNCGVMQFGDGQVTLRNKRLPKGLSRQTFVCDQQYFSDMVGTDTLHVFSTFLHMHQLGKRAWTYMYSTNSSGASVRQLLDRNDHYSHALQVTVPTSVQLKAGHYFTTSCVYNSPDDKQKYGLASDDEMCIDFVYYYPEKKGLSLCGAELGGIAELGTKLDKDIVCFGADGACSEDTVPTKVNPDLVPQESFRPFNSLNSCSDDPTGVVAQTGTSCTWLSMMGCDNDLHTDIPAVSPGTLVKSVCLSSCNNCPCKDDPTNVLAQAGASCALLKNLGCKSDLHSMNPAAPKGSIVEIVCPVTCDACSGSGSVSSQPARPPIVVAKPAITGSTAGSNLSKTPSISPSPICPARKFRVVSAQYRESCVGTSIQGSVYLNRNCATSDLRLLKTQSSTFLTNLNGHCLNEGLKFGNCTGQQRVFVVEKVSNTAFSLKLANLMCATALASGSLGISSCNNSQPQQFFFVPML